MPKNYFLMKDLYEIHVKSSFSNLDQHILKPWLMHSSPKRPGCILMWVHESEMNCQKRFDMIYVKKYSDTSIQLKICKPKIWMIYYLPFSQSVLAVKSCSTLFLIPPHTQYCLIFVLCSLNTSVTDKRIKTVKISSGFKVNVIFL